MTKIYIGNLSYQTTEQQIETAFKEYGQVQSVSIIRDPQTGDSRGFGFVEMDDQANAQAAIAGLNGQTFDGRTVTVNLARPKSDRRGDSSQRRRRY